MPPAAATGIRRCLENPCTEQSCAGLWGITSFTKRDRGQTEGNIQLQERKTQPKGPEQSRRFLPPPARALLRLELQLCRDRCGVYRGKNTSAEEAGGGGGSLIQHHTHPKACTTTRCSSRTGASCTRAKKSPARSDLCPGSCVS